MRLRVTMFSRLLFLLDGSEREWVQILDAGEKEANAEKLRLILV